MKTLHPLRVPNVHADRRGRLYLRLPGREDRCDGPLLCPRHFRAPPTQADEACFFFGADGNIYVDAPAPAAAPCGHCGGPGPYYLQYRHLADENPATLCLDCVCQACASPA
jgi:hypothetical protein